MLLVALELPETEQIPYLEEACGHDAELFAEAEALLRSEIEAHSQGFLQTPEVRMTDESGSIGAKESAPLESSLWRRCLNQLVVIAEDPAQFNESESVSAAVSSLVENAESIYQPYFGRDSLWPLLVEVAIQRKSTQERKIKADEADEQIHLAMNVANEYERLLNLLPSNLRNIARMNIECCSDQEIAGKLGLLQRSVARKLKLIRGIWKRETES